MKKILLSLFVVINSFLILMLSARAQESLGVKMGAITFEFKMVCDNKSESCEKAVIKDTQEELYVQKDSFIGLKDIVSAESRKVELLRYATDTFKKMDINTLPTRTLIVKFNERGKDRLAEVTSQNVKKRISIFIDGYLVLAPLIQEPILDGEIAITFSSPKKIEEIAERINKAVSQAY